MSEGHHSHARQAAIVTVGSELVEGLRVDTNTAEIARTLAQRGFAVTQAVSVGDDVTVLSAVLKSLLEKCDLVVTTGGLGPTHDDITREAAANALGARLTRDDRVAALLGRAVDRHADPEAREQVLKQADVIEGAIILDPTTGTAPGLIVSAPRGELVLLPGPPSEMRPMLAQVAERYAAVRAHPRELGVTGLTESDAQVLVSRELDGSDGIGFTILAQPGDVRVLLMDDGAGSGSVDDAAGRIAEALGVHCYAVDGGTLAEATVRALAEAGLTVAFAESCTGGMATAALTEVPGASEVLLGGVVAYANSVKSAVLDVPQGLLAQYGAVSEQTARAMAEGARTRLCADIAVSTTGIAGPDGGSDEKPVGTVWFALADETGTRAITRHISGSRAAVRARATATALDLARRRALGI